MRLGATVLLANQTCVQSYGWTYFRPLGVLQTVVDELDCFECDEIAIVRPARRHDTLDRFAQDIEVLKSLKSMTPISFGGGIRSKEYVALLDGLPIERLIFSSAFVLQDEALLKLVAERFGRQSIQCLLPVFMKNDTTHFYNCTSGECEPLQSLDMGFINTFANEIIVHDCQNEGKRNAFEWQFLDQMNTDYSRLIVSGGVGEKTIRQSAEGHVASVLLDNKTLHQEYSVAGYKHASNM